MLVFYFYIFFILVLFFFCFFFFQAEDGIRDRNVTGVQTCALPISSLFGRCRSKATSEKRSQHCRATNRSAPNRASKARCRRAETTFRTGVENLATYRSEERRVGKECRSRWSPHQENKKKQKQERGR